jgi:Brp/Blh family beta-carotene 15,15'-monooxygenase
MTLLTAKSALLPSVHNDFAGTRLLGFAVFTVLACWFEKSPYGSTGSGQTLLARIALIAIAIAVWHGAYDGTLARPRFEPWVGRWWFPVFASGYLLLFGATLIAWYVAPAPTLVAFLVYSSWHFGTEQDVERLTLGGAVSGFAYGALPIAAGCYWHPNQVVTIFRAMLGSSANPAFPLDLTRVCAALLWVIIGLAALGALLGMRGRAQSTLLSLMSLIAVELLLFWCCDPLLAFAIYFCVWHTPEHLVSTSLDGDNVFRQRIMFQNLGAGIPAWIGALGALAVVLAFRSQSLPGYASGLFVLLSALTVPHMGLNEIRRFARH